MYVQGVAELGMRTRFADAQAVMFHTRTQAYWDMHMLDELLLSVSHSLLSLPKFNSTSLICLCYRDRRFSSTKNFSSRSRPTTLLNDLRLAAALVMTMMIQICYLAVARECDRAVPLRYTNRT